MTQLNLFDAGLSAAVVLPPRAEPAGEPKSHRIPSGGPETTSLKELAELIRQGREQLQGQRRRENTIQPIGQLAQQVLWRHDLVARRRAAAGRATAGCAAAGRAVSGEVAGEASAVWVATSPDNNCQVDSCQIAS